MTTEAQRQCKKMNVSFEETFGFQYVIAPNDLRLPNFNTVNIGNLWLHIGPELFHFPLFDKNEQPFGYLLGAAADGEGREPQEALLTHFDSEAPGALDWFENYLVDMAGRYMFVVNIAGEWRGYFDPVGMIGAVYNKETRRLASSPLLTIDREIIPSPHYDHEAVMEGKGGYGLSHTADAEIFRLNANHYINLESFEHARFWPKESDVFAADETEYGAIYDEIISKSRNIIKSLTSRFMTVLPLSGGNDSRLLFALAGKEGREEIAEAYTHINNFANRRDAVVAAAICDIVSMPYEIHDRRLWKMPRFKTKKAVRRWQIGSGTNIPAPLEVENGLVYKIRPASLVMRGHQTNIMRGQYFNFKDPKNSSDPSWVLRMCNLAKNQSDESAKQYFLDELQSFIDDLPKSTEPVEADFLFLEALVPAALGPLFQGIGQAFYLSPFNSRRLVQLSMQFSTSHKLRNFATHDIIMRAEPELSTLPAANSLPANFQESSEIVKNRQAFIELTRKRYENYFDQSAPEIITEAFDSGPYERALATERERLKHQEDAEQSTKK